MKTALALLLLLIFAPMTLAFSTEIVVIVHPKNPISKMPGEQVAQFFLGKSANLGPIDQRDGSELRIEFYQKLTGKETAQVKAIWSKIVFNGKGLPPAEYASSAEVKKAVAANPLTIGYIEKSALDDSVKAVLTVP